MNGDLRREPDLRELLGEIAPSRAPNRLRRDFLASMDHVQPRRRWLAIIKAPPMRLSSRVAVGSPVARLAYLIVLSLILTLIAVVGVVAGTWLLRSPAPVRATCVDGFCAARPLSVTRAYQTATRLLDGSVLIVGGEVEPESNLTTAELWDPKTETTVLTGPLLDAHAHHTATLLPDGRVLIAGGLSNRNGAAVDSAEIYDPTTREFTPTGPLAIGRGYHTATALADGRALIVGGLATGYQQVPTAELWDPATGTFGPAGSLAEPRSDHTATLLLDGTVLVIGGGGSQFNSFDSTERWDPDSLTFSPASPLAQKRTLHTSTVLPDGRVLVVSGGVNPRASRFLDSTEVWDPVTGAFSASGPLAQPRGRHTATLLSDGRVVVIGGYTFASDADLASAETWDPMTGAFSPAGSLSLERMDQTATLLADDRVLVTGGLVDGNVHTASTEIWDPRSLPSVSPVP